MKKNSTIGWMIVFLLLAYTGNAQSRYAVYFTDKAASPFSINNPSAFLTQRSLDRRLRSSIEISEQDIPVNDAYVEQVHQLEGVDVFYRSRWTNSVLVQCSEDRLSAILDLSFVNSIELLAPGVQANLGGRWAGINDKLDIEETLTTPQNDLTGVESMINDDILGRGVLMACLDSGFPGVNTGEGFTHFYTSHFMGGYDFVRNSENVFIGHPHGTRTLSVIAGYIPETFQGAAINADIYLFSTEDPSSEYRVEEYYWLLGAEKADSLGVDIITASIGYYDFDDASMNYTQADLDGRTALITKAANWAVEKGILVVTSAGNYANGDWGKVSFPSDCFDCFSIAAVNGFGEKASFSSPGPTADGRLSPNLAALGVGVQVIDPFSVVSSANGTSYSAPMVSGLLAGVMEKYPGLPYLEYKSLLENTASQAWEPETTLGYGIPNYVAIKNYQEAGTTGDKLSIFPNPVISSSLFIESNTPYEIGEINISMYDTMGKQLLETKAQFDWLNNRKVLDLTDLNQGMYLLIIEGENIQFNKRIMIR